MMHQHAKPIKEPEANDNISTLPSRSRTSKVPTTTQHTVTKGHFEDPFFKTEEEEENGQASSARLVKERRPSLRRAAPRIHHPRAAAANHHELPPSPTRNARQITTSKRDDGGYEPPDDDGENSPTPLCRTRRPRSLRRSAPSVHLTGSVAPPQPPSPPSSSRTINVTSNINIPSTASQAESRSRWRNDYIDYVRLQRDPIYAEYRRKEKECRDAVRRLTLAKNQVNGRDNR